ncbi:unnamed protein product [Pieris macdunnoughi]|uniref:Uncharacterized protein n=1 Tax=Pieris macdunnoughi TaxID=345717 RepID=A0A821Y4T5_9NEOP|nr:unnamed protein product [Pieris macdunnoughi]
MIVRTLLVPGHSQTRGGRDLPRRGRSRGQRSQQLRGARARPACSLRSNVLRGCYVWATDVLRESYGTR